MGLADKAAAAAPADSGGTGEPFKKPDISSVIPPEVKDVVDRVVAAGMKIMYSPAARDDLMKAVQSTDPLPKTLAMNITGLMLMIDQKAGKSGIPPQAIGPASMELLGDACELMSQSKPVTMDDYKSAAQMMFVLIGKKLGASDADIMDAANKALPEDQQVAGGAPPDGPAADVAAAAAPPAGATPPADPNAPPAGGPPVAPVAPPGAPAATAPPPTDEEEV